MKYIKVTFKGLSYIDTVEGAKSFVEEMDINERATFEVVEMTEDEFKNLPEFKGF